MDPNVYDPWTDKIVHQVAKKFSNCDVIKNILGLVPQPHIHEDL
jgi:hypothetical protein